MSGAGRHGYNGSALTQPVRRRVKAGHRRLFVVLDPGAAAGALLHVRAAWQREPFTVTIEGLYYMLAAKAAASKPRRRRRA